MLPQSAQCAGTARQGYEACSLRPLAAAGPSFCQPLRLHRRYRPAPPRAATPGPATESREAHHPPGEPTERLLTWASRHDLTSWDIGQLVELGADVAATDPTTGQSALHHAAARGNADAVSALLMAGADPRAKDQAGKTALHYAAEAVAAGRAREPHLAAGTLPQLVQPTSGGLAVAGLVEAGGDLDAADNDGMTPRTILLRHVASEVGIRLEDLLTCPTGL